MNIDPMRDKKPVNFGSRARVFDCESYSIAQAIRLQSFGVDSFLFCTFQSSDGGYLDHGQIWTPSCFCPTSIVGTAVPTALPRHRNRLGFDAGADTSSIANVRAKNKEAVRSKLSDCQLERKPSRRAYSIL